jgi:hypothetical protein
LPRGGAAGQAEIDELKARLAALEAAQGGAS